MAASAKAAAWRKWRRNGSLKKASTAAAAAEISNQAAA